MLFADKARKLIWAFSVGWTSIERCFNGLRSLDVGQIRCHLFESL